MNRTVIYNINVDWSLKTLGKDGLNQKQTIIAHLLMNHVTPESNDITATQIKSAIQGVYPKDFMKESRIFEVIITLAHNGLLIPSTPGKFKINPDICFAQYEDELTKGA